jgi:hypothetical protein
MTNNNLTFFVHNTNLAPSYSVPALDEAFKDFEVIALEVFPYKEVLDRDGKKILWQSKQVSFSAKATCPI